MGWRSSPWAQWASIVTDWTNSPTSIFSPLWRTGHKDAFIDDLTWLSRIAPVAYTFRNTADGYKLLYADGVFCEFAVFTPDELVAATYPPGRLVWGRADFDATLATPRRRPPARRDPDPDHLLGEALTNLYVGLGRFHRGEKLSAMRFIQGYAVDRFIELSDLIAPDSSGNADAFDGPRRYEQRYPTLAAVLPEIMQGYERSPKSAVALLALLEAHFTVNPAMKTAILALASPGHTAET